MRHTTALAASALLLLGLSACERPGPAERLGEEVDEAVEDARNGGETLGNKLDDAADDLRDRVDDAREEIEK
jgi:hyperosmotically inducible periplasmic protein